MREGEREWEEGGNSDGEKNIEEEREVNGPGRRAKDKGSKGVSSWLHICLLASLMVPFLWSCLQCRHRV